jgi:hypothetical protein
MEAGNMVNYLRFQSYSDHVPAYNVFNKKNEYLGIVVKDRKWNKWVFEPDEGTRYTTSCMMEIISFIEGLREGGIECKKEG